MNLIFLLLFTVSAWADPTLRLLFPDVDVNQGEIIEVQLIVEADGANLEWQKLKGSVHADTIYILDLSPFMKKEGRPEFEAEAKIIFVKVPKTNELKSKIGTTPITVKWDPVTINPTEAPQGFLLGNFEIPRPGKLLLWIGALIFLLTLVFGGYVIIRPKMLAKREKKQRRLALKRELLGCTQFSDAVTLWQKKHVFISEFPVIEDPFVEFEKIINKHQFKPRQSEAEKIEVMEAYGSFRTKIQGGLDGV